MGQIRILAVDDEQHYLDIFQEFFENRGYSIETINDPEKSIELIDNNEYDVALLDIKMGKLNGDDIIRYINSNNKNMQIICITAFSEVDYLNKLKGDGVFRVVDKPIASLVALEDLVKAAYDKKLGGEE